MARLGLCCALSAALLCAASAGQAETLDCWLLDGKRLEQARQQGTCADAFARNTDAAPEPPRGTAQSKAHSKGGGKQVAAAHTLKTAPPAKPPRAPVAQARPEASVPPSWNASREDTREAVADAAQAPVQAAPSAPRDPVAQALHGLQQDFNYFLYDLDRDFRAFGRFLSRAGNGSSATDMQVSER